MSRRRSWKHKDLNSFQAILLNCKSIWYFLFLVWLLANHRFDHNDYNQNTTVWLFYGLGHFQVFEVAMDISAPEVCRPSV